MTKIVINDFEELDKALELRAKINHHAAVKDAVAQKTTKKAKPRARA